MSKKVPLCLKQPDRIQLVYGDRILEVDMGDFTRYSVAVDEDQVESLKPYLWSGDDEQ